MGRYSGRASIITVFILTARLKSTRARCLDLAPPSREQRARKPGEDKDLPLHDLQSTNLFKLRFPTGNSPSGKELFSRALLIANVFASGNVLGSSSGRGIPLSPIGQPLGYEIHEFNFCRQDALYSCASRRTTGVLQCRGNNVLEELCLLYALLHRLDRLLVHRKPYPCESTVFKSTLIEKYYAFHYFAFFD